MKIKLILKIAFLTIQNIRTRNIPSITLHVKTAGTLPFIIGKSRKHQITDLTLTGNLNGTDIRFIRDMAGNDYNGDDTNGKLANLNLAGVLILSGGNSYYILSDTTQDNPISNLFFYCCKSLKNIILPNSVTSIREWAFSGCTGLTSLTIPNNVTSIGKRAFANCTNLTSLTIPNNVTSIGDYAFSGCTSLTSITIPDSVTSIGEYAFEGCTRLTSIIIPNSVISIGRDTFRSCTGLTSVTIGNSVTEIAKNTFNGCTRLTSITIPNSVTSIGKYAFRYCTGLTSITIPNSVTVIGGSAFSRCTGLTSITIPNNITAIEDGIFSGCTGLTSVTIPNNVISIGDYAFSGCIGLTSLTIPNNVTSIGEKAFSDCAGLTNVVIGNNVTDVGWRAFEGCIALINITIGDKLTSLEDNLLPYGKNIFISENNTTYSSIDGILFNKDKTKIISYPKNKSGTYIIPNSIISIGHRAFEGCTGLTSITIPNSVTSIDLGAFSGCTGLTSITIPNSVTVIDDSAFTFTRCTGLKEFIVAEENKSYSSFEGVLFNKDKTLLIIYPKARLSTYIIPNSVTEIGKYAFSGCTGLTSIAIPNSVTSIGRSAFSNCRGTTEFIVSEQNQRYSSLEGVLFNKDKTSLIAYPIAQSRTAYIIPNSVTSIGNGAFEGCTRLTSITIPNSVTSIESYAFSGCTGLTSITIPNGVTTIENGIFFGCTGLTSLTIPYDVTSIGSYAFVNCTGLTEIHSKNPTPPKSYSDCFNNVNKITCKLYVPKGFYAYYRLAAGWSEFNNTIVEEIDSSINIFSYDNTSIQLTARGIAINAKEQITVSVYTPLGQVVYRQSRIIGNTEILLNGGVYVLRVNNKSQKIVIK